MIRPHDDAISPTPFIEELRNYSAALLRLDLQSGITVAVFAVPQAMAYAMLAGLPPVHGLYAAVVMSVVAAIWGSSPHVNTGPTNSAALLTAAALLPLAQSGNLLELVFQFTLMVGLLRMAMGLFKLGWLVRFVPETAFLGFMIGAGTLIAFGQLHHLLGVSGSTHPSFPVRLYEVLSQSGQANFYALGIGLSTLAIMLALDRYSKTFPVALAAIALATTAACLLGENAAVRLVRDIAPVPTGLPHLVLHPIDFSLTGELFPSAVAVAFIGLIEAVSIGQALALKERRRLNFNQEFFGQGLSQFIGAFFQGFPGSGSFSRSALIEQTGGQTRLANIFFGLFTALALLFLPRWLDLIPVAALAGLLLFIGTKLIDVGKVRRVWNTNRAEFSVLALTFFVTVFIKIEYGFFAGIVAAMIVFLNKARVLQLFELVPLPRQGFEERAYTPDSRHEKSDVVALSLQGQLFFGVAGPLRSQLNEIVLEQEPKYLIIRTRRAHSIDYSCWSAIFDFAQSFGEQGGKVYLAGMQPHFVQAIRDAGMQEILPLDQRFAYCGVPMQAFYQAIAEVRRILPEENHLSPAWREYFRYLPKPGA